MPGELTTARCEPDPRSGRTWPTAMDRRRRGPGRVALDALREMHEKVATTWDSALAEPWPRTDRRRG